MRKNQCFLIYEGSPGSATKLRADSDSPCDPDSEYIWVHHTPTQPRRSALYIRRETSHSTQVQKSLLRLTAPCAWFGLNSSWCAILVIPKCSTEFGTLKRAEQTSEAECLSQCQYRTKVCGEAREMRWTSRMCGNACKASASECEAHVRMYKDNRAVLDESENAWWDCVKGRRCAK